DTDNVYQPAT
ncbi:hypothetical protein D046_7194B, partial [Vibrio parahaemolyticus V-223/04]